MKNKTLLIVLPLCFLFLFNGKKYDEAVKERLFLPVKMCLEGEDCGTSSQAIQMASDCRIALAQDCKGGKNGVLRN